MNCRGRVAVVTGAAGQGMGRSIALTLAREGACVVANYRNSRESAQAIVEYIVARGGEAMAVQADVFEAGGCRHLVEQTVERFGQVDVCVIGPGAGWHPDPPERVVAEVALEDARRELAPVYHLLPLVLPGMAARGWGRVIAVSLEPGYGSPSYAYNVAKAARTHALLLAHRDAGKNGVTLNVIGPGPVEGIKSLDQAVEQCDGGSAWKQRSEVSPQDIAEGVAFLCSEAGRFISGCTLRYT
jgi:NAD(P)-dependent dehydrogenase (short-subunit alcohol dehydrogenase family)